MRHVEKVVHTYQTDSGDIAVVAETDGNGRILSLVMRLGGSGRQPLNISVVELGELAEIASEAHLALKPKPPVDSIESVA